MKKLLILCFIPLFAFTAAHKFYVSLTDIEYNPKTQALQIISRLFIDDTEKLLKTRYNEEVFLSGEQEHELADQYLEEYLQDKLQISVNGEQQEVQYLGKEYKADKLVLYLEVENVESVEEITVYNTVLSDIFPEQKNVVKVEVQDEIKGLLLGNFRESGSLLFAN